MILYKKFDLNLDVVHADMGKAYSILHDASLLMYYASVLRFYATQGYYCTTRACFGKSSRN